MNRQEANELLVSIRDEICHKGMPINIRKGTDDDIADYVNGIVERNITIDEPLGTVMGYDYDACPKCKAVVGNHARYCKMCGAYIRI